MIARITRAYLRHYRDNGQTTAYVEWLDDRGRAGRTEGAAPAAPCPTCGERHPHMAALFRRAEREGLTIEREEW